MKNRDLLVNDFLLDEPVVLEETENTDSVDTEKFVDESPVSAEFDLETEDSEPVEESDKQVNLRAETLEENKSLPNETDINNIFKMANNNVKEATNIFHKNMEMKLKIEEKYKQFKREKEDFELKKVAAQKKIDAYKEEVYGKLKSKKNEIEAEINNLKIAQKKLEQDKANFEEQKREELAKIKQEKNKELEEIGEKRSELETLEVSLRLERENIEEQKRGLELDRIKYESDMSELTNNLLKFNELVGDFSDGMGRFNENKTEE